jgi:chemotaxis methyl-accepting protein methylase
LDGSIACVDLAPDIREVVDFPGFDRYHRVIFQGTPAKPRPAFVRSLSSLASPVQPGADYDPAELELIDLALRRSGLDPSCYRLPPLIRRVAACLRALRVETVEQAAELVAGSADKASTAINSLLIGATGFFRDPRVFAELESLVIPRLLKKSPHPRVWSAACSTGAELYSVGMLLEERGSLAPGQLCGTDCRESCVRSGLRGVYHGTGMDGVSHSRIARHFTEHAGLFEVRPEIRAAASWGIDDLNRNEEPTARKTFHDLILCRNVAIYLDPAAVQQLWRRLAAALAPGGFLIVGKAEKINLPQFRRIAPCIYALSE